jgi:hypothetical protein
MLPVLSGLENQRQQAYLTTPTPPMPLIEQNEHPHSRRSPYQASSHPKYVPDPDIPRHDPLLNVVVKIEVWHLSFKGLARFYINALILMDLNIPYCGTSREILTILASARTVLTSTFVKRGSNTILNQG